MKVCRLSIDVLVPTDDVPSRYVITLGRVWLSRWRFIHDPSKGLMLMRVAPDNISPGAISGLGSIRSPVVLCLGNFERNYGADRGSTEKPSQNLKQIFDCHDVPAQVTVKIVA